MANKSLYSLKKKRDFERLREKGRVDHVSHWLMVVSTVNGLEFNRAGWTLPRFVGNAVLRNRLKRWGRERINKWNTEKWSRKKDINFVFRKKPVGFYRELSREEFGTIFEKAFKRLS